MEADHSGTKYIPVGFEETETKKVLDSFFADDEDEENPGVGVDLNQNQSQIEQPKNELMFSQSSRNVNIGLIIVASFFSLVMFIRLFTYSPSSHTSSSNTTPHTGGEAHNLPLSFHPTFKPTNFPIPSPSLIPSLSPAEIKAIPHETKPPPTFFDAVNSNNDFGSHGNSNSSPNASLPYGVQTKLKISDIASLPGCWKKCYQDPYYRLTDTLLVDEQSPFNFNNTCEGMFVNYGNCIR